MHLFSAPKTQVTFFGPPFPNSSSTTNANPTLSRSLVNVPINVPINVLAATPLFKFPPISSKNGSASAIQEHVACSESDGTRGEEGEDEEEGKGLKDGPNEEKNELLLSVRRPVKEESVEVIESKDVITGKIGGSLYPLTSKFDQGLSEFAKRIPIFEPERAVAPEDRPLGINLELRLYRAKVLCRNFQIKKAEQVLQKCILYWPEDGRAYVALGKLLCKQSKFAEARYWYERGSQATQGENSFIWQCWAVLENKVGNVKRARELFDAAIVADERHVAAWHGWAVLEINLGNLNKARNLLGKGLKYSGGNEYIYQTFAILEAKENRLEQARYLFQQATQCNPKSCASWLAWAQVEMKQENNHFARILFEKAVQSSPKNRFAWHVWGTFEASQGHIEKARKLFKIGHALNQRDPVLLQSLALLEYKHSSANIARVLFKRASAIDPMHQPAWGWMEWKEENINMARELYRRAVSIDIKSESAARCLQAWAVLEQRAGNLSAARRLFQASLNINSQSYVTWMTWAAFEDDQGNAVRAEEIRNLYFQQRTEVVDNASWVTGILDIFDPAVDSIKRLLNLDQSSPEYLRSQETLRRLKESKGGGTASSSDNIEGENGFDLDLFIKEKLSLDVSKLDVQMGKYERRSFPTKRDLWIRANSSKSAFSAPATKII